MSEGGTECDENCTDGCYDRKGLLAPPDSNTRRAMMSHRSYVKAASHRSPLSLSLFFPKTIIIVAVGCFPVIFLGRRSVGPRRERENRAGAGAAIT